MKAGYARVSRKDQRLERRGAGREPGCRPRGGDGGPARRGAALAGLARRALRARGRRRADRASLEGAGAAGWPEPERRQRMTTQRDGTNTPAGEDRPTTNRSDEQRRAPGPGGQSTMPPRRTWLWFALILLANFLLVRLLFPGPEAAIEVPYTFFKEQVQAGNVEAITINQGDNIEGRFEKPVTYPPKGEGGSEPGSTPSRTSETFTTVLPSFVIPDPALEQFLIDNGVQITAEPIQQGSSLWQTLLFAFGPALLLIGGYIWLYRRAQQQGGGLGGGLTGVGRSRARRYDQESETRVTFDDVAGIDEAENELVEIVDFLKDPKKYTRLGGTAPKGVLLVGPPGTGKTLLARAVAGEAGVPFFSLSASEFVELFVGVGASRVRDLFKQARE